MPGKQNTTFDIHTGRDNSGGGKKDTLTPKMGGGTSDLSHSITGTSVSRSK